MVRFPSGWFDKAHWLCLLLAVGLVGPSYWTALTSPATGVYHDDAIYLITAKSLAEGRGYVIESPPQAMPQTKYPVLFPALLSLVWRWQPDFPKNLIWLKLVPLLAAGVWLTLSWLLIRLRTSNSWLATAIVAVTASSPQVVFLSTAVLSETLFAALFTGALLCWGRYDGGGRPGWLIGSAILSAAAYHTRTIGLCLILAGLLALAYRRNWRHCLLFGGIAFALVSPWLVWQWSHRGAIDPYLSQENYYTAYNVLANFAWPEKLRIVATNFALILSSAGPVFDLPAVMILGWVASPLVVRGAIRGRMGLAASISLAISIALMLLWAWPPLRFVIPLLPLLLWAIAEGTPQRLRAGVLVCCWVLFAAGCYRSHLFSLTARESGCWYPLSASTDVWRSFEAQMEWLRKNTAANDIVQSNVDPTIYLFTGRHAVRGSYGNASLKLYLEDPHPLGKVEDFARTLRRSEVRYVVETPWPWFLENPIMGDFYRGLQSELTLKHSAPGGYRIYSLAASGASAR
jgi:hypothetical protein